MEYCKFCGHSDLAHVYFELTPDGRPNCSSCERDGKVNPAHAFQEGMQRSEMLPGAAAIVTWFGVCAFLSPLYQSGTPIILVFGLALLAAVGAYVVVKGMS